MAKIKGITIEIGGETVGLTKAMEGVNKQSNSLQRELKEVERLLKLDPKNTELLEQKQKLLGQSVETTKEKLNALKEAEKQVQEQVKKGEASEEQYRALQREIVKTEQELKGFEKRLKDTNPQLEAFGAKAKEVGGKLKDVGGKLTKGVTLPLAAAGAGLVAVGTKFDDIYDDIRIGSGATGEALQELKDDFKAIAKETPAALEDVGKAVADYNTRLGISGTALQELSKQTLELARITGSDLSATIEETSQSFQAFNVPVEEYGQSLDFVFKVSQSTGIGVNRLQQNMVKFAPALKQLDFSFEQSATLMGQLDKAGVDVEQTLAGLTKAIATMAKKGVTDGSQALEMLFDQIKDAPSDIEGTQAALEIFGNRAGPALASAIREGKLSYTDLLKELQGSDETILGVAGETKDFAERFIELKNNVMIALEPLGERLFEAINGLVPLFQSLVGFIGGLIEKFANLPSGVQSAILIFGAILAALGPLLSLVGALTTALPALAGAFSVLMGPVGIVIAAIAALIAIGVLLYKNWDTIKEACGKAWDWIVDKIKGAINGIKSFFTKLLDFVKNNWKEILLFITNPIAGAIALLYKLNPKFKEWVDNLIASIKQWFAKMIDVGKEIVTGLWDGITKSWTWLTEKIKEWCGNILGAIKTFFGIKSPSKYTAEFGRYLVQGLAEGISEDMSAEEAAEKKAKNVLDKFKSLATGLKLDVDISRGKYELWLSENAGATDEEKLAKQTEYLIGQHEQQAEAVNLAEAAYIDMVARTGEASNESRELEKQLLAEKKALSDLTNQINETIDAKEKLYMAGVEKTKADIDTAQGNLKDAQFGYADYLRQNYKTLASFGLSASDIFATARKVSGLDKAEADVKSITVNQTIETTAATPSEIREAARDGVTLATKEAYA